MNFGRLRCLGTQTRLKTRFGTGYQLQFHCVPGKAQEVENFIEAQLPKATHTETYAGGHVYVSHQYRISSSTHKRCYGDGSS